MMADRSNQRLNEAIENMIRMWDGTIHGQTIRNMYENGARSPGSSMKIMRRSESGRSKEMDRQEVPGLL